MKKPSGKKVYHSNSEKRRIEIQSMPQSISVRVPEGKEALEGIKKRRGPYNIKRIKNKEPAKPKECKHKHKIARDEKGKRIMNSQGYWTCECGATMFPNTKWFMPIESRDEKKYTECFLCHKKFKAQKSMYCPDCRHLFDIGDNQGVSVLLLKDKVKGLGQRIDELKEKHNEFGHVFEAYVRNLWTEIGLLKDKIEKLEKKLTKRKHD